MPPSELSNRDLKTDSGASIKLPGADALFGKKEANSNKPIDLQVSLKKNRLLRHYLHVISSR